MSRQAYIPARKNNCLRLHAFCNKLAALRCNAIDNV